MFPIFWSLLLYLMATITVSTVQARCSFIPDCNACYVSTYGDTREEDLWTVVCRFFFRDCSTLCSGLRSLNSTVELLDLSHSYVSLHGCSYQPSCNFQSSDAPSVFEIDLSYAHVHDLSSLLNIFINSVLTLKLKYARVDRFIETLSFSSYPMLRNADLSGTFRTLRDGDMSLIGATSLETLYLDNNHLSEVPYAIRNMRSLKHLSLQHNLLNKTALNKSNIFPLSLESLDISHNNFQGSADFSWMKSVNLRTLRMQNTSIGSYYLPKRLGNMSNLKELDVSANTLTRYALDHIEKFPGLRVFNFSFNKLREVPTAIQRSSLLRRLYLRSNDIWYVAPETFMNISNLSVLDLGGNKIDYLPSITFSGVEESLDQLYLDGNQLNTLDKCIILRLTRLRRIRIGGNPFNCDCKIAWLRSYRDNKGVDIDLDRTFCTSPIELKGMNVSGFLTEGCTSPHLTLDMNDCFKFISPTSNVVTETSPKHTVTETSPKHTDSTTDGDEPQQMTSSHDVTQVTGNEAQPLTSLHFSRQALSSAYLAVGFSATCLAIIVVYIVVTGCRFYRRRRGKQSKAPTKSERTISGLQDTTCTEVGETGPYEELEIVSPYQNVADLNPPTENSYDALNPHTAT